MGRRLSLAGLIAASTASVAVLAVAGLGAVAHNTSVLTPGDVQVLEGFEIADLPAAADPARPATKTVQPLNILLLGSDTREGQGGGFGDKDVYSGARSDTAMLIHVSADRRRAVGVSFPRDLRVDVPACGSSPAYPDTRFNVAFEVGGAACTTRVVQDITGLTVDDVVVVDFRGFQAIVDSIGGIEVCLNEALFDVNAKLDLPAGRQVVNGEQALALARARKTLADGSDTSRIGRQQALLRTAFEQVTSDGLLADPIRTYQILSSVGDTLSVSPSLASTAAMAALAAELSHLSPSAVKFRTVPWLPAGDNETVVLDQEKAQKLFENLRADMNEVAEVPVVPGSTDDSSVTRDDTAVTRDDSSSVSPKTTTVCGKDALF